MIDERKKVMQMRGRRSREEDDNERSITINSFSLPAFVFTFFFLFIFHFFCVAQHARTTKIIINQKIHFLVSLNILEKLLIHHLEK